MVDHGLNSDAGRCVAVGEGGGEDGVGEGALEEGDGMESNAWHLVWLGCWDT